MRCMNFRRLLYVRVRALRLIPDIYNSRHSISENFVQLQLPHPFIGGELLIKLENGALRDYENFKCFC